VAQEYRESESGFVTAQFMAVVALSMLFLAGLLNLIAIQYAQGVMRGALDEGLRVGAPAPATPAECVAAIDRVMSDLLSGPFGAGITYSCIQVGGELVAMAEGRFVGWFPGFPTLNFDVEVRATKESGE
jgi:hypothetical protein